MGWAHELERKKKVQSPSRNPCLIEKSVLDARSLGNSSMGSKISIDFRLEVEQ